MNKKSLLFSVLPFLLNEGEEIQLGNDTFLTNFLDGSDKFYGFQKDKVGILWVVERQAVYPVEDMNDTDIDYIFNRGIFRKLVNGEYKEKRVYAVAHYDDIPTNWSNEEFISHAESEGLVWTLRNFEQAFNIEDISTEWFIRII